MTDRSGQRSTLAMMVLALLEEDPMHPYRMHELIRQRGKENVVNVARRNSVYQTIARLVRAGLVDVHSTSRDEGRPERVMYRSTPAGAASLRAWLEDMLSSPSREYPEFPAALSIMMLLPPREVEKTLERRRAAQEARLAESQRECELALAQGLPRLFLVEEQYRQSMMRAELDWLARTVHELKTGKLSWTRAWIRKVAADAERVEATQPPKRRRKTR